MRRLNGDLLKKALMARGWTNEDFVAALMGKGYQVSGVHTVQKWLKGKTQPSAERIRLIERMLGYGICDKLKTRRKFGKPERIDLTKYA